MDSHPIKALNITNSFLNLPKMFHQVVLLYNRENKENNFPKKGNFLAYPKIAVINQRCNIKDFINNVLRN